MRGMSSDPTRRESDQQAENLRQLEADAMSRQSNVLPLDAARNEGRFYGQLIRGDRSLNGVQRVGFFLIGAMFCSWAIFILVGALPRLASLIGFRRDLSDKTISMLYLPVAALVLFLGVKVVVTALRPSHRPKP
jgi:hypothetical protein